jgi:hypothetical protein
MGAKVRYADGKTNGIPLSKKLVSVNLNYSIKMPFLA